MICVSIDHCLNGQGKVITYNFADSVERYNYRAGKNIKAILTYNDAVKSFGYLDTISIVCSENQFKYIYRDTEIKEYRSQILRGPIDIEYAISTESVFLVSRTQKSPTESFEMVIINVENDQNDLLYKLTNYTDGVINGRYEERTKSGKIIVSGLYCQIDSTYSDTLQLFNIETYEDIIKIVPRKKYPVKSGIWKYYTPEGKLQNKEVFRKCS